MHSKMTTNSQLSTTESKNQTKPKQTNKKLSKQHKQEQNHRDGDQWGGAWERMVEKVLGIRCIIGRYIMDCRMLRIV